MQTWRACAQKQTVWNTCSTSRGSTWPADECNCLKSQRDRMEPSSRRCPLIQQRTSEEVLQQEDEWQVCSGLWWLPKRIVLHCSPVFLRHNYCFSVHLLKTSVSPLKRSPTHLESSHVGALGVLLHHLSLIAGTLLRICILYIPSNPLYGSQLSLNQHIWLSVYTSGCCLEVMKLRKTHYCLEICWRRIRV